VIFRSATCLSPKFLANRHPEVIQLTCLVASVPTSAVTPLIGTYNAKLKRSSIVNSLVAGVKKRSILSQYTSFRRTATCARARFT
jgi:hypothetical protein